MKFVKIASIKSAGIQPVYDLSMKEKEDPSFIANKFVVHNSAESAYSTFLETCNAYRTHVTNVLFYKKIFPLLAVSNKMFKDKSDTKVNSVQDFLFNASNKHNLRMPTLHWHKDLTAKTESNMMETLEKLSEKGVPVPIKTWVAAAGMDIESLKKDQKDDAEARRALGIPDQQEGPEGSELTSRSIKTGMPTKMSILDRTFGSDLFNIGKTGQKKHVHNASSKQTDLNHRIAKIASRMETDPNYREEIRRRNVEKLGSATLKGF